MNDLYRLNGGAPAPLPAVAYGENGDAYTAPFADDDLAGLGYVLAPAKPDDTQTQTAEWNGTRWVMVDRPPAPPKPEPQPATIGKLEFILLAQAAGGMTDTMLVDAQKNPAFAAFWIKYQMASAVERDSPVTSASLDALAASGYLPKGKQAVLTAWPTA